LGNTYIAVTSKATRNTLAPRPTVVLANPITASKVILAVVLVAVRRPTSGPDFIDSALLWDNASTSMALSRIVGTPKGGARSATQVAGASGPRAPGLSGTGEAVKAASTSPRIGRGALSRLIGTACSRARNGIDQGAKVSRPSASVDRDARVAVVEAGASSPVGREVVAAHGGVESVVQIVGICCDVVVSRSTVIVRGVRRGNAGPCAKLRVISERIVLAQVAWGAALTGAGITADSLRH
jgi:hypothetical protein